MNSPADKLKSLPLENIHIGLKAKMVPFGGWNMPIQYPKGIIHEHLHTRNQVSLFDCSHMGQFRIWGNKAASDLNRLFPRSVVNQKIGSCRYNFLLNDKGMVIDDLIVYRISDTEFYLVVNGATISADREHIRMHLSKETEFRDESPDTVKIDVQGPNSLKFLVENNFFQDIIPDYYKFIQGKVDDIPCLISRTGYTGELGFEIYLDSKFGELVWDKLISANGIEPAGLGARDTLRLEMGYPLYGHELSLDVTPITAGFGKILQNDHDFIGKVGLQNKPTYQLVGIQFEGRRSVREGASVLDENGNSIGKITSGSYSPSLKCAISLAFINIDYTDTIKRIFGKVGKNLIPGRIEPLPFYRKGTVRSG